jgi:hypothetical protein
MTGETLNSGSSRPNDSSWMTTCTNSGLEDESLLPIRTQPTTNISRRTGLDQLTNPDFVPNDSNRMTCINTKLEDNQASPLPNPHAATTNISRRTGLDQSDRDQCTSGGHPLSRNISYQQACARRTGHLWSFHDSFCTSLGTSSNPDLPAQFLAHRPHTNSNWKTSALLPIRTQPTTNISRRTGLEVQKQTGGLPFESPPCII